MLARARQRVLCEIMHLAAIEHDTIFEQIRITHLRRGISPAIAERVRARISIGSAQSCYTACMSSIGYGIINVCPRI